LSDVAKELKLTQEQAQRIADLGAKQSERWLQAQQEVMQKAEEQWLETVQTDKEIGGDKLNENVAVALKAIDTFGSPELKAFLKESRLGNHPEMIRFAYRAGKAIANDSVVPGGRSTNGERKPLYDNSDHR
jgi:oligoendopeptidase F